MTFMYVALALLGIVSWFFSMLAAFMLGQACMVRAHMRHKETLISGVKELWERIKGGNDAKV